MNNGDGSSLPAFLHGSLCLQVVGHKKGLDVMERADPLFLLMGLPTIPVMLVLGKMIRWEDYVLRIWRKYSSKLQALQALMPGKERYLYLQALPPPLSVCIEAKGQERSFPLLGSGFKRGISKRRGWQQWSFLLCLHLVLNMLCVLPQGNGNGDLSKWVKLILFSVTNNCFA